MVFFPKNKFLDAAAKTILLFATFHILVILVAFLKTGNFSILHIARILEINRILPVNIGGAMQNITSFLFVVLVYSIMYLRFTK